MSFLWLWQQKAARLDHKEISSLARELGKAGEDQQGKEKSEERVNWHELVCVTFKGK